MTDARSVIIGVSGGVAAYKACHLVRYFTELGDDVRVVPTVNALNFVGAATFEALSGNPVDTGVFSRVDEVQHVKVGRDADLIVVAPATADVIARIAAGRADDLLTATLLVATCPVVVVPAMHTEMWNNPAAQANVATLRQRGITVMEPAHGRLTGPDSGAGRLPEPDAIGEFAQTVAAGYRPTHDWVGRKLVVSAGGTEEALDPVRYLGNRSSGRQGFALGEIAAQRGAQVTIVAGRTDDLPAPSGAHICRVESTREMEKTMREESRDADVVIMAAAVADYRPAHEATAKLKKGADNGALETVELVENPDILAGLVRARENGDLRQDAVIVGFAAETGDETASPLEHAQAKFARKGCDVMMANEVGRGKVFGQSTNEGWLLAKDCSPRQIASGSKQVVAAQILDGVNALLPERPGENAL